MKLEYGLVAAAITLVYLVIVHFWPEFPVSAEVFEIVVLALLAAIGIEIVRPLAFRIRKLFGLR